MGDIIIYIYIYKFGVNLIKVDKPSSLAQCASTKLKDKGIDGKWEMIKKNKKRD